MATAPRYIWWNGRIIPFEEATIHVTALGWSTMGAVFEGIKSYWNAAEQQLYGLQFAEHYNRFIDSMRLQRMELRWSATELADVSAELLRMNNCREDTQIRPIAYFGGVDWFQTCANASTDCFIWTAPFTAILGNGRTIRACVSSWTRLSDNMMSPRIKCISNYQNSRMALHDANRLGFDSTILLNDQGKVTEGPAACLFIVRNGVAITPSITSGILESVTRRTLLKMCGEQLGIPTEEREVDRTELYIADEIFFCGTGAEIQPVGEIDGYVVGTGGVGPLTTRIEALFHDMVRGRTAHSLYRTPIYPARVEVSAAPAVGG